MTFICYCLEFPKTRNSKSLVHDVRGMSICPSAQKGKDIPALLREIIDRAVYKSDYSEITEYFQNHPVSYDTVVQALEQIVVGGMFEDTEFEKQESMLQQKG